MSEHRPRFKLRVDLRRELDGTRHIPVLRSTAGNTPSLDDRRPRIGGTVGKSRQSRPD
jgi:hypothetical protein